ncbi:MAG: hypothetical protein C5B51_02880 [Terriglobia bacterium]|nr:MAG: hypothetical protein C5B51_02880 [Terriglobia bacterium]
MRTTRFVPAGSSAPPNWRAGAVSAAGAGRKTFSERLGSGCGAGAGADPVNSILETSLMSSVWIWSPRSTRTCRAVPPR